MRERQPARPWTAAEDEYLTRHFGTRGGTWCAEKLGRTVGSVRGRARRLHLVSGVGNATFITVAAVATELGVTYTTIYTRAEREGVLKRFGKSTRTGKALAVHVPRKWARELIQNYPRTTEAELQAAGWLSIRETADYLGVSFSLVKHALNGDMGLAPHLQHARKERVRARRGPSKLMLHPQDVEAARVALDEERRTVTEGVSLKEIAVELDVTLQAVRARAEARGVQPRYVLGRGVRAHHVTRDEARVLLAGGRRNRGLAPW